MKDGRNQNRCVHAAEYFPLHKVLHNNSILYGVPPDVACYPERPKLVKYQTNSFSGRFIRHNSLMRQISWSDASLQL